MRFSLKQMLTCCVLLSVALGYGITSGVGVAVVFSFLAVLTWHCLARARTGWHDFGRFQRTYAVATAIGAILLLVTYVFKVETDPSIARERNRRSLLITLSNDIRFQAIDVTYHERKVTAIRIDGVVKSDADFEVLQSKIQGYDWQKMDGVIWHVYVAESGVRHDHSDWDIFKGVSKHGKPDDL